MTTPTVREALENFNRYFTSANGVPPNDRISVPLAEWQQLYAALAAQPELPEHEKWIERWYGSGGREGYEGWSIVTAKTRELVCYLGRSVSSDAVHEIVFAHNAQLQQAVEQAQHSHKSLIGLSVSVDVSTGDDDAGNRLFGTVYEVQEDSQSKDSITLLVADVEANFEQAQAKREPMSQAQRDELIRSLQPECFDDKDEWDDALIEGVEAHHNIGDKA